MITCNFLKNSIILKVITLFFGLLLVLTPAYSQPNSSIEGLVKMLNRADDSTKVVALKLLCWEHRNTDTANALNYGYKAIELAKKLNLPYELADVYNRLGVVKRNQSKYADALDFYFKGLEISQQNNYPKLLALEYNNIADIYNRLGIYDKALEFAKRGLVFSEKIDDELTLGYVYNIMGVVYKNMNKLDSALYSFNKSLQIRQKINFTSGIATSYLNIGTVFFLTGKYDSSYSYISKSISIYNDKNDQTGLASSYKQLGIFYNHTKEYKKAIECFNKSLEFNKSFGDLPLENEVNEGLRYSYEKLGDTKKAYYYLDLASRINDSITINTFVERITHLTENFKFELQRQEEKQREASLTDKLSYRRTINALGFIILGLVVALGIITIRYSKLKKNLMK